MPYATGILPILTVVAAGALAVLMVGAVATHLRRKEPFAPAAVITLLLVGVAAGRLL